MKKVINLYSVIFCNEKYIFAGKGLIYVLHQSANIRKFYQKNQ